MKNIPTDLYNEHVVKLIKGLITTMGSNLTEKGLQRAARSVSSVYAISKQYDKESGVPVTTQQRDEEKKENEKSKNNLEAFIFETRDAMFLEGVIAVSTDAERQTASDALKEAADWLEEDGYTA